jgi:hypothetical protein
MRHTVLLLLAAVSFFQGANAQEVRVKQDTPIRSGPSDDSYDCGWLRAGMTVNVLDWPRGGSRYAMIEAPANAISLIPASALDHMFSPTKKPGTSHPLLRAELPLIDGNPGNETYLSGAKGPIPKNIPVVVVGEKQILDPVTKKHKVKYYQIRAHVGEFRYVHADHLEGGPAYSQPNIPTLTSNSTSNSMWNKSPASAAPPPADLGEVEQLPPAVINDIHAADVAYHEAITTRYWDDARQRYSLMTGSPYASVRILAINRLEFIRQWQLNPQPVLPARQLAENVTAGMPPANLAPFPPYQGTTQAGVWIPGGEGQASRSSLSAHAVPKQVVIRPNQAPVETRPSVSPPTQLTSVPVYPAAPSPNYQQQQPVAAAASVQPAAGPTPPFTKTVKQIGQLNRAQQFDGHNPLYYLVNSQGMPTYYVKAMSTSRIDLSNLVGRYVELEGTIVDRRAELGKDQLNVISVKLLQ